MSIQTLFNLIGILTTILAGLYVFAIFTKMSQNRRLKAEQIYRRAITADLDRLLMAPDADYNELFQAFVTDSLNNIKKKACRVMFDKVLLEYLEESGSERRQKLLALADALGYPALCMPQIKSRSSRNIASGCRKAGLYQYKEAIPHMLEALSILSGDTQFQILMGLSRLGDVEAMCQAFNAISRHTIVNERTVCEILEAFSGDKYALYKLMIHCEEEYIAALFLKSLESDLAADLAGDIVDILNSGGKEVRIAAIKAIGKIKEIAPAYHLRKALRDDEWEVRAIAAKALGQLIDPDAGEALAAALHDPEWWVRQNAAASLLSYPACEELFASVMRTKDAYAWDSIVYALESAKRQDILLKLQPAPAKHEWKEMLSCCNI